MIFSLIAVQTDKESVIVACAVNSVTNLIIIVSDIDDISNHNLINDKLITFLYKIDKWLSYYSSQTQSVLPTVQCNLMKRVHCNLTR